MPDMPRQAGTVEFRPPLFTVVRAEHLKVAELNIIEPTLLGFFKDGHKWITVTSQYGVLFPMFTSLENASAFMLTGKNTDDYLALQLEKKDILELLKYLPPGAVQFVQLDDISCLIRPADLLDYVEREWP